MDPAPVKTAQHRHRSGRVCRHRGIGEIPRCERAGFPEEGLELVLVDGRPGAVGGRKGLKQPPQTTHVAAEVFAQAGRGPGVEADGSGAQVLGQPLRSGPDPSRRRYRRPSRTRR